MADDDMDYDELIDGFTLEEAIICCADCGITATDEFSLDVIKAALRNRYCPTGESAAEVFARMVDDGSSGMTVPQAQHAAALLGGMLLHAADLQAAFAAMDTDGDGTVVLAEFEGWWTRQQKDEEEALEREWAVTECQRCVRGYLGRMAVASDKGFVVAVDLTLQEPDIAEAATALMFDLDDGNGPSDWVTLDEAMEFIMEGSLTDDTSVWTEGMDDWMPLRKCRSWFNFGEDRCDYHHQF